MPGVIFLRPTGLQRAERRGQTGRRAAISGKPRAMIPRRARGQTFIYKEARRGRAGPHGSPRRPVLRCRTARSGIRDGPFRSQKLAPSQSSEAQAVTHRRHDGKESRHIGRRLLPSPTFRPAAPARRGQAACPRSAVGLNSDFVLPPDRLPSTFVEDAAGYIEKKREAR